MPEMCKVHCVLQHSPTLQDTGSIHYHPQSQFSERTPPSPHLPTSHRLGASEALLELLYPVNWPQLIEPEIVNQAWLPRLLLLGIWNWTSKRAMWRLVTWMEVIQTQEHPVKKDLPPCAWRRRRGSEEREKNEGVAERETEDNILFLVPVPHDAPCWFHWFGLLIYVLFFIF